MSQPHHTYPQAQTPQSRLMSRLQPFPVTTTPGPPPRPKTQASTLRFTSYPSPTPTPRPNAASPTPYPLAQETPKIPIPPATSLLPPLPTPSPEQRSPGCTQLFPAPVLNPAHPARRRAPACIISPPCPRQCPTLPYRQPTPAHDQPRPRVCTDVPTGPAQPFLEPHTLDPPLPPTKNSPRPAPELPVSFPIHLHPVCLHPTWRPPILTHAIALIVTSPHPSCLPMSLLTATAAPSSTRPPCPMSLMPAFIHLPPTPTQTPDP
ncbi:uncharacterized protein [Salvelinus sp. IW2-2015]|uniref:uncharacterized protein n=1 Tax=Salvelinus sp. IW2-2015 TaxID=2691554 RepID=UPI000CEA8A83|nr:extensin-like [Salvelinus alpinus]